MRELKDYMNKEPYNSILKEIYHELIVVLTFSTGISALAKPLTSLVKDFAFVMTFSEFFLFLICTLFIILSNLKSDKKVIIFIKNIITIIGFTLLLIPTINILTKVAGFNNSFPLHSYFVFYGSAIIVYSIKNIIFNNIQSK